MLDRTFLSKKLQVGVLEAEDIDEGEMRTLDVFLQRKGKIRLDFTDESYGEVYIEVLNSSGQAVYSNRTNVIFDEVSCSTDKLPQGSYRIVIKANENFVDFEVNAYIVYTPDWKYPEVTTDSKKIKIVRGKIKKIKLYSNPQQANYEVYWTSEDSSIAKVMSDGTVKAKKKESVKIYADIYTDDGEFYDDLQWTVTVMPKNPSFKSVSKKMKSFKQKYLKYKLVKKNKKAILYGGYNTVKWNKKVYTEGFGHIGTLYPYIELNKKSGKTSIELRFVCNVTLVSINIYDDMGLNRVSFKSGSKKVKFDYNSSYKDKIKKCILQITNNGTVRLSSNSKENIDKINTLEKIQERKHVTLKASDTEEGAYVKYELNNLTKKTWKKVISDYKKILEMY